MTTIKISQLPDATVPLSGTEVVPLDQAGVTKKVAVSDLSPNGFLTPEQHRLSKIQCIGLHNEAVDLRGWGYGGVGRSTF